MAVFKRMFKKFLGFEEEFQEENTFTEQLNNLNSYYSSDVKQEVETKENNNELHRINSLKNMYYQNESLLNNEKAKEVVYYPKTFGDACDVIENLEMGNIVVVNMEDVDIDTCKRISDFILGAIYVLQGDVEKISKKTFRFWTNK